MSERYDFIAIGPHGVYALHEAGGSARDAEAFIDRARSRGHRIERVPVAEAVERHLAYLRQDPRFAAMIDARAPSPPRTEDEMSDDNLLLELRSLARVLDKDSGPDYAHTVRWAVIEIVRLRAEVDQLGKLAVRERLSTSGALNMER